MKEEKNSTHDMKRRLILLFLFLILVGVGIKLFYTEWAREQEADHITLFGNIDVRQVDLGFRVSGRVIAMPFEEGDFVAAGSLIGELDQQPYLDLVKEAKANAAAIQINLENTELLLKRRQELIADGSVSQEDLENTTASRNALIANHQQAIAALGAAQTNLEDTKIFAPSDGTILTRIREPGTVVRAADPIYTLSIISPVWVRAFIPEKYLGVVFPGMRAEILTDSPDKKNYTGQVGFISPVAEFTPKTVETTELRSDLVYRLRIIADNPDRGLRQGMPVTVRLFLEQK